MQKRLCVDFDGTLCRSEYPYIGKRFLPHKIIAWYVRMKKRQGWIIILNTLRTNKDLLDMAVYACKHEFNIPIDYVNENTKEDVQMWGDSRKISCDINIDDRNIGFIGWLLRRYEI